MIDKKGIAFKYYKHFSRNCLLCLMKNINVTFSNTQLEISKRGKNKFN